MDKYLKAREEVAAVTRRMYETKLVNAYEGNVSMRIGDHVLITPGSVHKGSVTAETIVEVDMNGNSLQKSCQYFPSSEGKMHYAIYQQRPDAMAVVHNHSVFASAYAVARKPIDTKSVPEMIVLFGTIPVLSYGTPGTPEVYADLHQYGKETSVFLIANHGLVAVGSNPWDAYEKAVAVEKTAQILIMASLVGGEHPIEENNLEKLYEMRRNFVNNLF